MKLTIHAQQRMNQRGIDRKMMELVLGGINKAAFQLHNGLPL